MLHREHICIEIGNPLLALLGEAKVAQGIPDIGSDRLPKEICIVCAQVRKRALFILSFSAVSALGFGMGRQPLPPRYSAYPYRCVSLDALVAQAVLRGERGRPPKPSRHAPPKAAAGIAVDAMPWP
jgi:hypothetical protein